MSNPESLRDTRGGDAIDGPPLGILMLETRFPRIPGDIGNALTWPHPVLYKVVRGATPQRVVLEDPAALLPDFIAAARELVSQGAEAITTSCGFLALFQSELAAAVEVPVATTALLQVPWVQATLPPGRRVGVITVSRGTLSAAHLAAAGVPTDVPLAGTEDGHEFFRVIVEGAKDDLDAALAEADIIAAGRDLLRRHPEVGAIVLECTNMPPYAAALAAAVSVPVYDIVSLMRWLCGGLRPRRYARA
ncbi:MAG: aspartate/glutamate racemase family protein [Burkholderiales bacterium]|nr:aspartate/glutamate racemase family protein [Burkholderiales bacterium]